MVNGEEPVESDAVALRRAMPEPEATEPEWTGPEATEDSSAAAGPDPGAAEPPEADSSTPEPSTPEPSEPDPGTPASAAAGTTAATPAGAAPVPASAGAAVASGAAPDGLSIAPVRHRRGLLWRGAHAVGRLAPHRAVAIGVRNTVAWSRRPHGRLASTGLLIAALLVVTGAAGAYLVPKTVASDTPAASTAERPLAEQGADEPHTAAPAPPADAVPSGQPALPPSSVPTFTSTTGPPVGVAGARPADALAGWAQQMAARVDIPQVALQAYGYAELVLAQSTPACQLSWTTLAAIGKVESNHGSSNGATLQPDGQAVPAIVGPALDGKDGRAAIPDTDGGQLDNDTQWDHAVGPMQFIPSTWRTQAVDADNDGSRNPNDVDDAALASANYLCSGGRDMATPQGWWDAIASYNIPRSYGEAVFAMANTYGTQSRS